MRRHLVERLLESLGGSSPLDVEGALERGHAYELACRALRKRGATVPPGVVYTPAPLARRLARLLHEQVPEARVALDPACGAGALLIAWLEVCPEARVVGRDIDPEALRLAHGLLEALGVPASRFVLERVGLFESALPEADVIVMNPPFGTMLATRARTLAATSLFAGREPDAFALALEKVLEIDAVGLGAIVPDVVRMQVEYVGLRRALTESGRLRVVAQQGFGTFEEVTVQPCLLVLGAERALDQPVRIELAEGFADVRTPAALLDEPDCRWRPTRSALAAAWRRASHTGTPLGELVACHEGVHTGNIRAKLFTTEGAAPRARRLYKGADIRPFACEFRGRYVHYDPALIDRSAGEYASLRDPIIFRGPKLLSRQTTSRLTVCLDPSDAVTDNTLHTLRARAREVDLRWLAVVLNSELMTALYRYESGEGRRPLPQVKLRMLRRLPICPPLASAARVAKLHDRACREARSEGLAAATRAALEGIVFDSYNVPESDRDSFFSEQCGSGGQGVR